jgi:hypothetical protein
MGESRQPENSRNRGAENRALTRRRLLLASSGGLALAASLGIWGRFALGDSFERHVAAQLGLDLELTTALLGQLREERGDYDLRASAFLAATHGPSAATLPDGIRRELIESLVRPLFGVQQGKPVQLDYAGLRRATSYEPCGVLVP